MSDKNTAYYASLEPGHIISSASYTFLPDDVAAYIAATGPVLALSFYSE
jgi:hypothetical protein